VKSAATALADEIARAARRPGAARALILDLDGTLAPITRRPRDASVPAAVLSALSSLVRDGWRVAIVSGRPVADARRMVPLPGVTVFGSHGIERGESRSIPRRLRAIALRAALMAQQARDWIRDFRGVEVERKPFGFAIHHRTLEATVRPRFRRRLRAWLAGRDTRGLELHHGRRVIELRPAGLGKGLVARRWPAARLARRGDRSLVAIGDDRTDEDLFAALAGRGLTVQVGSPRRATIAVRRLSGAPAVARLLAVLAAAGSPVRRDARR
jgi:trehalose-phosphatase